MRFNPVYAPDGMTSITRAVDHFDDTRRVDHFDDGLVHNHHWAVTADEAYPAHSQGQAIEHPCSHEAASFPFHPNDDRHDDGLVHNHGWAVSGQ